ncbi:hypothetical protein C8Q80DRAFT_1120340 [Daedaleopsis nitida]|nr:hypothetical protein C8Q80DRAFT_1120340 [Daedaleopsis nitida]
MASSSQSPTNSLALYHNRDKSFFDACLAYLDSMDSLPVRRPGPRPTAAFGFILDNECRRRWAHYLLQLSEDADEVFKLPPDEFEDELEGSKLTVPTLLPIIIYFAIPELPRIRNRMLPVEKAGAISPPWIFILRDNGTRANMTAPLDPDLIEQVKVKLGVEEQEPKWYRIPWVEVKLVLNCWNRIVMYVLSSLILVLLWLICLVNTR